jgi:hypothetical protein
MIGLDNMIASEVALGSKLILKANEGDKRNSHNCAGSGYKCPT